MAINKFTAAALKALSYADINMKKHYRASRRFTDMVHYPRTIGHKISDSTITAQGRDIPIRVFTPENMRSDDVIMFFHGGGWVIGSVAGYTNTCSVMAERTGQRVVSVDYRLAPEHKFPKAPEDCYAAARALHLGRIDDKIGGACTAVTLVGDSAGGNLAAVVSLMAAARGEFAVSRQVLFYPATYYDHSETSPFASVHENGTDYMLTSKRVCDYMDLYMPDKDKRVNPFFAPLTAEDLSGQPKTLIITAQYDPLRDEGEAYGEKLRRFGNDVTVYRMADALHGFLSLPSRFAHVRKSYELMNEFLYGGGTYGEGME